MREMCALPSETDRPSFEERVNTWFPAADAKAWFVTTEYGMVTARALAGTFMRVAKESGITGEVEAQLSARIETTLTEYSERLGCGTLNTQAREMFRRGNAGKTVSQVAHGFLRIEPVSDIAAQPPDPRFYGAGPS